MEVRIFLLLFILSVPTCSSDDGTRPDDTTGV
jgi:hypothetical protein